MKSIEDNLKTVFEKSIIENLSADTPLYKEDLEKYYILLHKNYKKLKFYKYTSANYYSIRNIETDSILFKNCSEFNDVFEGIPSFKNDKELNRSNLIRKSAAITCLCEEPNNLLMFAHYAESYSGICIEYNLAFLEDNPILEYLFPIIYVSSPSKLEEIDTLSKKIKKSIADTDHKICLEKLYDIISFFIHKPSIWNYEKEWRIIIPISEYYDFFKTKYDHNQKRYVLSNFDCISKIYFGNKIEEFKKNHIIQIVKNKNENRHEENKIKLFDTNLNGKEYKLDYDEIGL